MSSVSVPKLDAGHRAASPVPRPVSKNFAPTGTAVWPPSLHFDMETQIELGLDSFGDVTRENGQPLPHAQVLRNVVAEAVLADQLGIYFIGLGEHHRPDFSISSPEIVLAAIAGQTEQIKLGTAVTVLSSDDPVRVFQRFSTLDAVSNGRAEIILGRGSFTESFPLFGYKLDQYELLFEEKLELFAALLESNRTGEPVSWSGQTRGPLKDVRVYPPTESGRLTTWVGVGGSPESVVRAARYRLPLMLAIIGGEPRRFKPFVDLYHRALQQFGAPRLPIGVHSPGHVARKIAATVKLLGAVRFDLKYTSGTLPHELAMKSIELYGREVIPKV